MKNPTGVQPLPSSIAPQAELAWVTSRGIQAVVEMCDMCQGHCSCCLLPSPSCGIMWLLCGFPLAKGTTDLKDHCTKEPVTAEESQESCGSFPKCQFWNLKIDTPKFLATGFFLLRHSHSYSVIDRHYFGRTKWAITTGSYKSSLSSGKFRLKDNLDVTILKD